MPTACCAPGPNGRAAAYSPAPPIPPGMPTPFLLLRALRRAGITHNDLAKPQNWLMSAGRARRPSSTSSSPPATAAAAASYRVMAYRGFPPTSCSRCAPFAPELMTPTAKRILSPPCRSLPQPHLGWRRARSSYNFVTRGIFRWSDGEGTHEPAGCRRPGGPRRLSGARRRFRRRHHHLSPCRARGSASTPSSRPPARCARIETSADIVQDVVILPRDAQGRPTPRPPQTASP